MRCRWMVPLLLVFIMHETVRATNTSTRNCLRHERWTFIGRKLTVYVGWYVRFGPRSAVCSSVCVMFYFFYTDFVFCCFFPFASVWHSSWSNRCSGLHREERNEKKNTLHNTAQMNANGSNVCVCAIEILQRQFSGDDFRFALLWFRITHERTCLRCAFSTLRFGSYAKRS